MQEAQDMNEILVMAAYGPPLGEGKYDLDFAAGGGNVGDASLVDLLTKNNVSVGIFSAFWNQVVMPKRILNKKSTNSR